MNKSTANSLTKNDLTSIGINTLIVGASAAVAYLSTQMAHVDVGVWTPIVTVGLAALGKTLDRYLRDTK